PTVRSYLIDRLGPGGADPDVLLAHLAPEPRTSIPRVVLLALGESDSLLPSQRKRLSAELISLYQNDPDPGIHSAADWLLRQWRKGATGPPLVHHEPKGAPKGRPTWYVNGQGQTMVVIPGPVQFMMGEERDGKNPHLEQIGRSYALAARELTLKEFHAFCADHQYHYHPQWAPTPDCPVMEVSWHHAAAYCNWLSEREGIPRDQWCYEPNVPGLFAAGMRHAPNALGRTGYRLPTEAEWEYACRAGSVTLWSHGQADDLIGKYAWYRSNAQERSYPTGLLRPNALGLFDMHGNAWEWVHEGAVPRKAAARAEE